MSNLTVSTWNTSQIKYVTADLRRLTALDLHEISADLKVRDIPNHAQVHNTSTNTLAVHYAWDGE